MHEDNVPNAVPVTRFTEGERPEYIPVEADNRQVEVTDRAIAKLHRNVGHPGNKAFKSVLKCAGAADWIIDRAGAYRCDVCHATSMRNSTPVACAENPAPLDVISVDGVEWTQPVTRASSRCTLIIDEGSLKASGRVHETSEENERIYSNTHPQEAWDTLMKVWF